jgi:hypothetical protein
VNSAWECSGLMTVIVMYPKNRPFPYIRDPMWSDRDLRISKSEPRSGSPPLLGASRVGKLHLGGTCEYSLGGDPRAARAGPVPRGEGTWPRMPSDDDARASTRPRDPPGYPGCRDSVRASGTEGPRPRAGAGTWKKSKSQVPPARSGRGLRRPAGPATGPGRRRGRTHGTQKGSEVPGSRGRGSEASTRHPMAGEGEPPAGSRHGRPDGREPSGTEPCGAQVPPGPTSGPGGLGPDLRDVGNRHGSV